MKVVQSYVATFFALVFLSGVISCTHMGAAEPQKGTQAVPAGPLDAILKDYQLETIYETSFDEPLKMIHEKELSDDGKTLTKEVPEGIDWVLEGNADVTVKDGRMHMKNDNYHCVLWNTRVFPDSFVAEWDFKHEHPAGTAILFFAAHAEDGGSIFTPGLPIRGGSFGSYTKQAKGHTMSYHTSYSATDGTGVPRASLHFKKNGGTPMGKGGGISPIDGKTDRPYRVRIAKIGPRVIIEVDNQISVDKTDDSAEPFTIGQIGFRQMTHTVEGSYGNLKIQRIK